MSVNIKGHERPISILINSLKNNSLAGSYLFIGPEGIGKSLVAKYFAKVLNCEKNNLQACGICVPCKKIENLNHPDIHWINSESAASIKIEQIRILAQEINLRAFEARYKVFIILDAQNLTEEATNCLLKTLEEPPINSLIILTTSQIKNIFPTIASRCQKITFRGLSPLELENILIKEYKIPENLSRYLSFASEGRLGKSLSLNNPNILLEKNQLIDNFLNFSHRSYSEEQVFEDRDKQRQFLIILLQWFRDILLLKSGADKSSLINFDREDELGKLRDKYSFDEILSGLKSIIRTNESLDQNLNVKISISLLREKLCRG